ncbi:MAG TPA: AAA domain-containing protein, partial [Polyangiaceae bacterium]|nr:AAA domain-containing protein [Polyangiaceae bacterium]
DVVIFDEASQCRLEEGLPVLLRAKRVVIAGDPQQLPPTRFFESGVEQSKDEEAENEQELFEVQQTKVEDLLGAALNLSVEQAYLDVHYRSNNADLIQFSNRNFYESRLQPIPAHPSSRAALPPLRLVPVNGVYEERANKREAAEVVSIVKRLLDSDKPPSIGIACFNLNQRDAIIEALDRAASEDTVFGSRLAVARSRKGEASFEGLFVRNLESVQGDERDHIIISTTYGPDKQGRFYRRFGPLGQAGGGRRLNVLVTRARQIVHLVTSIPAAMYRSLPVPPAGTTPNGGWLLFSYLAYAEELEHLYAQEYARLTGPAASRECHVQGTKSPSVLAESLGRHLAECHDTSSIVHWGNDGFCVDAAMVHPERSDDVTIGVLCDGARFDKAADRVQWDIFRSEVLESQRWRLFRLWSPEFFRNPAGAVEALKEAVATWLAEEAATKTATAPKQTDARLLN